MNTISARRHPWPAHEWTREYGFPGEVDEQDVSNRSTSCEAYPEAASNTLPGLFVSEEQSDGARRKE